MIIDLLRQAFNPIKRGVLTVAGIGDVERECTGCGSLLKLRVASVLKDTTSGTATETITGMIPAGSIVLGATALVKTVLAGAGLTTWSLGVTSATTRYGTTLALAAGTTVSMSNHLAAALELRPAATDVLLTAAAGVFSSGQVRVTVFYLTSTPPTQ